MVEKLDKDRILELLAKADTKWYHAHTGEFKYREHLEFTADYLTRNYHRKGKRNGNT
jgi:hypothetical protein